MKKGKNMENGMIQHMKVISSLSKCKSSVYFFLSFIKKSVSSIWKPLSCSG